MLITTKALHWATVAASAIGGWTASAITASAGLAGLDAMMVAAACAGSASAILFLILDDTDRPPGRIFRRVAQVFASFLLGAAFGLFVGPSIANMSPLDRIGGVYMGGLIGFGVIGVLVSPSTMKTLGTWLIDMLTKRGGPDG